jgi:uncharacterized membrane protein YadS
VGFQEEPPRAQAQEYIKRVCITTTTFVAAEHKTVMPHQRFAASPSTLETQISVVQAGAVSDSVSNLIHGIDIARSLLLKDGIAILGLRLRGKDILFGIRATRPV